MVLLLHTLLLLLALPRSAETARLTKLSLLFHPCITLQSPSNSPFRHSYGNIERPMKIEIVVAPQPQSLASRVAPPPAAATVVEVAAPARLVSREYSLCISGPVAHAS
jgi:hypothetical protein